MISLTPQNLYDHFDFNQEKSTDSCHSYKLTWRLGRLLVGVSHQVKQPYLPAMERKEWLVECLTHSPTQQVGLDPTLGESRLRYWAEASLQADKPVFLRLPSTPTLPGKQYPLRWWFKCLLDRIIAAFLLLILSPLMLGLGLLLLNESSEPVLVRDWRVGERGKLFQVFKFRTQQSRFKGLMQQYRLEKLPQLVNVIQGDMSLIGPRPLNLREATQLRPQEWQRLNVLPGLTEAFREERRPIGTLFSTKLSLFQRSAYSYELTIPQASSLWKGVQTLFLSVPKVFSKLG